MRRPIKAHLVNRSNRPNRPVYRSKPVTHAILNLDLNSNRSNRPVNQSNRPVYRYEPIELSFLNSNFKLTDFYRFPAKPVRAGYGFGPRAGCGFGRYPTDPNSKFKFEFKKMKNFQKIPKNTSRCDESNGVKFSQKFVHLVQFAGI